jgi:hypothetical protein
MEWLVHNSYAYLSYRERLLRYAPEKQQPAPSGCVLSAAAYGRIRLRAVRRSFWVETKNPTAV